MRRDLPPLSLLLTFDVATRANSFKEAARQLCLTPSAVSQQIRALEAHLNVELFERTPRAVQLNDVGRQYAKVVAEALDLLSSGTRRLRRPGERQCVRISADPFFAGEIVIPLLPSLQCDHPEFQVCVESSQTIVDLRAQACDAALRFGRGSWPGLDAELLATATASPVAAPSLLARKPLRAVEDLAHHTLITVKDVPDYWALVARGHNFEISHRLVFSTFEETLHAARQGLGVTIALLPLMQSWLDSHGLLAPLPVRWEGPCFYLVYRSEDRELSSIRVLCERLRQAFAARASSHVTVGAQVERSE